jgi:hypothetical protein
LANLIAATHDSWRTATFGQDEEAAALCIQQLEWLTRQALRLLSDPVGAAPAPAALVDAVRAAAHDIPRIRAIVREPATRR